MTTEDKAPAQILRGAADYIRAHGWCASAAFDREGRACLIGAIRAARTPEPPHAGWDDTCDVAFEALQQHLGGEYPHIWNSAPGRTQAEVENALLSAAASLEARQ